MHATPAATSQSSDELLIACLDRLLTTADRTVFEHIDLGLGYNAQYEQADRLELLAHCGVVDEFANGGAKTRRVVAGDVT